MPDAAAGCDDRSAMPHAKPGMKEALNGMFWTRGVHFASPPRPGDIRKALAVLRKNIVPITWHALRTFENHPATPGQTAVILAGHSVTGLSLFDQMQVKNYGDGCKVLADLLSREAFSLSVEAACALHAVVGREDALEWGVLRRSGVSLRSIDYVPPVEHLDAVIQTGLDYLSKEISDPFERAVGTFLFLSRSQPFYDANKRTASLMMNGSLMDSGFFPLTVPGQHAEAFHLKLGKFYETGDADEMMDFFARTMEENYPPGERRGFGRRRKQRC